MQPLSQSLKQAIQEWQAGVVTLYPPATPDRIHMVLRDIGQRVSADVIELYTTTGGFGGMDGHGLCLWSLEEILEKNTATHRAGFAFADGLIDSHRYRIQYKNELESTVWIDYGGDLFFQVADNLAEFFHFYLTNTGDLNLI